MAFRILNEEEILLLTDKQRENYENELEVHCQRAAFVEKLTEIEKAEIKEYKPSLLKSVRRHFSQNPNLRTLILSVWLNLSFLLNFMANQILKLIYLKLLIKQM